jgi:hypothetical protein
LNVAIEQLIALAVLDQSVDLRKRNVMLGRKAKRVLALGTHQERRMRFLHQGRGQRRLLVDAEMLSAEFEILVCPRSANDFQRFQEHLSRLCLRYAECIELDRL